MLSRLMYGKHHWCCIDLHMVTQPLMEAHPNEGSEAGSVHYHGVKEQLVRSPYLRYHTPK